MIFARRHVILGSVALYAAAVIVLVVAWVSDLPVFAVAGIGMCVTHGMTLTWQLTVAQRLHRHLGAADWDDSAPLVSDRELDRLLALSVTCLPGPWEIEETDDAWMLHSAPVKPGGPTMQILKAAKHGTPYAEYWPGPAEAELICRARTIVPQLVEELRRQRLLRSAGVVCTQMSHERDGR